ncbi:hypothetical protein FJZ17_01600 [Candidatus Pacearchaeota archaeon]|nr:hypothetical protein [Candidatus Pacearchaeota archaeon]
MSLEKNLGDLKSADLSFLWDIYQAELQNLDWSLGLDDSEKVKEDLEDLIPVGKEILRRSYNQRLEFYNDLRRDQHIAIERENFEEAEDLKRQLIQYASVFLRRLRIDGFK